MDERKDRNAGAQPLNEAWWERVSEDRFPPDDVPLLAPYEKTRPGFELLVASKMLGRYFAVVESGHHQVCLWNIWEREKDPADSDEEKQRINEMQLQLGALDDDIRYIRLQIACLQRCWWEFPANVDLILDGISAGPVNLGAGVSCEPPWDECLKVLRRRCRHPGAQDTIYGGRYYCAATNYDPLHAPRQELVRAYMTILTWWSFRGDLNCLKQELPDYADLAEIIYRRLGSPTRLKVLYGEKVRTSIGWQAFPGGVDARETGELCRVRMEMCDAAIRQELGDEEDVIGRMIGTEDLCHHGFFRHIDHQLANIGASEIVSLPGAGEKRKRIHGAVTNYVHVLGSWLARRMVQEAVGIWPPCEDIARRVYDVLGDATPRRRWLVVCLWKKLLENEAEHGRGALDEQPERFAIPPEALTV